MGIGPEKLVGICMERSLEMMIAIVGLVKAGGAYLPLDPAYPAERLAFMLEDSTVSVVLTHSLASDRLPSCAARVIELDTEWEKIGKEPEQNPAGLNDAAHAAYVIYTSGSTGRPKGVVVAHSNVVRL